MEKEDGGRDGGTGLQLEVIQQEADLDRRGSGRSNAEL